MPPPRDEPKPTAPPADPRHETRRLAMQVLYQIDMTGETDRGSIAETLDTEHDPPETRAAGLDLALAAWAEHTTADSEISDAAPHWPTQRQPPVDRAILRLAYHELATARAPRRVVLNEAIELAKAYAGEQSPGFINAILDNLARRFPAAGAGTGTPPPPADDQDAWLADAVETKGPSPDATAGDA